MPETAIQTTSNRGGVRPNSGRPVGTLADKTIEKRRANEVFNQRVRKVADKLFVAQSQIALGSMKVIRVDVDQKGNKKYVHVTDTHEIIELLTEHHGLPGVVDGSYYFFQDVPPDNKALDSLLNRGLGKPAETFELNPSESLTNILNELQATFGDAAIERFQARFMTVDAEPDVKDVDENGEVVE